MFFGAGHDGSDDKPGGFGDRDIYARLLSYNILQKRRRSPYNKKLEKCLKAVGERITIPDGVRDEITAELWGRLGSR